MFTSDMFPGTNLNDLNLDWLIDEMKNLEQRVEALEEQINGNDDNEGG